MTNARVYDCYFDAFKCNREVSAIVSVVAALYVMLAIEIPARNPRHICLMVMLFISSVFSHRGMKYLPALGKIISDELISFRHLKDVLTITLYLVLCTEELYSGMKKNQPKKTKQRETVPESGPFVVNCHNVIFMACSIHPCFTALRFCFALR